MTNPHTHFHFLATFGLAGALATLAVPGCNGGSSPDSKGGGASGNSGTSNVGGDAGSISSGGSSSGTGPAGGSGATTSGGASGSAGADATGGMAGEAGGDPGGSSPTGGRSATGGDAGSSPGGAGPGGAGSGGSAGSGGGKTGTLGEPCSPRGALACAGNHQKLTILCGGDDTWQPNQTCASDQYCDSTPGPNVGTCRPVVPGCEAGPGAKTCGTDSQVITCGPDAVTTSSEPCDRICSNGECGGQAEECPVWGDYAAGAACTDDCPGVARSDDCIPTSAGCMSAYIRALPAVLRTPWPSQTCFTSCGRGGRGVDVAFATSVSFQYLRIRGPSLIAVHNCEPATDHCAVISSGDGYQFRMHLDTTSGPANIELDVVNGRDACNAQ